MATPIDNNAKPRSSHYDHIFSLQMLKEQSLDLAEDTPDFADESHKTRRVNPQRLAARLGPDIVAEMEALIYPGAKMPTFEVRRVIQERYAVDRRHIYDYFHSRGLRVAKEDKHTNLTRGRLSKALGQEARIETSTLSGNALQASQPAQVESKDGFNPTTNQPLVSTSPQQSLPAKSNAQVVTMEQGSLRNAKRVATERISGLKRIKRRRRALSSETCHHANRDRFSTKKHDRANQSVALLSTGLDSDLRARTPSPCPEFTIPEDSFDHYSMGSPALTFSSSSESVFEVWDMASDLDHNISLNGHKSDTLITIEKHRPLTPKERVELYNLINNNIGSTYGIEECVGSYCAYMKEQSQPYLNRISSITHWQAKNHSMTQEDGDINNQIESDVEVEFQQWFSVPEEPMQLLSQTSLVHPTEYLDSRLGASPKHSDMPLDTKERPENGSSKDATQPTSSETESQAARTRALYTRMLQQKHHLEQPASSDNQVVRISSLLYSGHSGDLARKPRVRMEGSIDPDFAHTTPSGLAPASKNVHPIPNFSDPFKFSLQIATARPNRMRTTSAGGGI